MPFSQSEQTSCAGLVRESDPPKMVEQIRVRIYFINCPEMMLPCDLWWVFQRPGFVSVWSRGDSAVERIKLKLLT